MAKLVSLFKDNYKTNPIILILVLALVVVLISFIWGTIAKGYNYLLSSLKGAASTLTKDEAQSIANAIQAEIHAMFTNEDNIIQKLVPLSKADYFKVKAEFGIKTYNITLDEFNALGSEMNLTEILNHTLSQDDKNKIKGQNPNLPIS
ncbi:hypothetical protein BUL40_15615 [Croceivirga radicis]|uniref:Uncharacterized protein n=1 Tax=Croceivirga radicis TaxID=1929488 RepID=A0A1V6LMU4_9FLAO|nr:hypothetical protein [Croceivirga radicis]OQD41504.1 hypothetical protein BUL40_15615 [Croceivirga radicis]